MLTNRFCEQVKKPRNVALGEGGADHQKWKQHWQRLKLISNLISRSSLICWISFCIIIAFYFSFFFWGIEFLDILDIYSGYFKYSFGYFGYLFWIFLNILLDILDIYSLIFLDILLNIFFNFPKNLRRFSNQFCGLSSCPRKVCESFAFFAASDHPIRFSKYPAWGQCGFTTSFPSRGFLVWFQNQFLVWDSLVLMLQTNRQESPTPGFSPAHSRRESGVLLGSPKSLFPSIFTIQSFLLAGKDFSVRGCFFLA